MGVRASHIRAASGVLIAGVGAWGAWTASEWRPEDGLYAIAVFSLVALFGLVTAVRDLRGGGRRPVDVPAAAGGPSAGGDPIQVTAGAGDGVATGGHAADQADGPISRERVLRLAAVTVLTIVYSLVWDIFGYTVPTFLYVLALLLTLGVRGWVALIAVPLGVTTFVLGVFGELLSIPLP